MKKLYLFLTLVAILNITKIFGQTLPPNQAGQSPCDALAFCGGIFHSAGHYVGAGSSPSVVGCTVPSNCVWLIVTITQAGNFVFDITPNNLYDDYDFAVIDITNSSCNTFNSANVIRCNANNNYWNYMTNGAIGLNTTSTLLTVPGGTYGNYYCQQIMANAGDVFLICIDYASNYADPTSTPSGFTFDMTASTALAQYAKPEFASLDSSCNKSMSVKVQLSKAIQCNSIAPDGSDFALSPSGTIASAVGTGCTPNGYTTEVTLNFANPLSAGTYLLNAQVGTDGNTLLDACDSSLETPASLSFDITPSTIQMISLDTPACNKARIILNEKILCSTVAADGTDFLITGPSGVAVTTATPHCTDGWADTIDIYLDQSIPVPGLYSLSVVVGSDTTGITDSCGHGVINQISWYVSDRGYITATASPNLICEPGYVDLLADTGIAAPAEGFGFKWSPGYLVGDSVAQNTNAFINTAFNTFEIRIMDSNHCYRRDTTNVTLSIRDPQILATQDDTAFCFGYGTQLLASGGVSYTWSPASGLDCTNCPDPFAQPATTTTYTATITDMYGCSDDLSRTITIYQLPELHVSEDTTVEYGTPVKLIANAPAGVYYYWEPITGLNNPNIATPIATPEISTRYTVRVADTNRCVSYDSLLVFIINNKPVALPNAFTPNGDGKNDVFKLANISYQELVEFRIFNRWGKEVFATNDINMGWDGTLNGEPQPIGTYSYLIRVNSPDTGGATTFKGTITLLR